MVSHDKLALMLKGILGTDYVYTNGPGNLGMSYPAFMIALDRVNQKNANNSRYALFPMYSVTYITYRQSDWIIDEVLKTVTGGSFSTRYIADDLYHYRFTIPQQ